MNKSNPNPQSNSGRTVPDQLTGFGRFIKLEPESKEPKIAPDRPLFSATDPKLTSWIENGGNVGLNLGRLVALDIDSGSMKKAAEDYLIPTFSVRSGSGGEHRYFLSDWSGQTQLTSPNGSDLGSVRSGNWYVVIPPSVHPNGNHYRVLEDRPIAKVPGQAIDDLLEDLTDRKTISQHSGGGGGGGGCVGGKARSIPGIPDEYPNRSGDWRTARKWLEQNGFLSLLDKTASSDWSGLEFKLAKCLAEAGLSESVISDTLDRLNQNAKWHKRGSDYQTRTVRNAITEAVADPYVSFVDTGDMDGNTSESRKTEESGKGRTLSGGENMSSNFDYNQKESLTVYNGDSPEDAEDGDRVIRVELTNMKGRDESGQVDTDFVSITKGTLRDNGEFGVSPEFPGDSKSVGSADPDDLRLIAEGLEQVADRIE